MEFLEREKDLARDRLLLGSPTLPNSLLLAATNPSPLAMDDALDAVIWWTLAGDIGRLEVEKADLGLDTRMAAAVFGRRL